MRMTDKEFENFREYVKCDWLTCAHGRGLAGMGRCVAGHFNLKGCPEYISESDFLAKWKDRTEEEKMIDACKIAAEEIL